MFENPRRGRQARNFTTNVPKILDLKSSSEQMLSENWRWVAAEKCTEGVISEMTTTSTGIRKNATIIKKLAYDISAVAKNCKS